MTEPAAQRTATAVAIILIVLVIGALCAVVIAGTVRLVDAIL